MKIPRSHTRALIPSSVTTTFGNAEFLTTSYPNINATIFDQPTEFLTSGSVALDYEIAIAAYNADAQCGYIAAMADLGGLHLSLENFELDALTVEHEDSLFRNASMEVFKITEVASFRKTV